MISGCIEEIIAKEEKEIEKSLKNEGHMIQMFNFPNLIFLKIGLKSPVNIFPHAMEVKFCNFLNCC